MSKTILGLDLGSNSIGWAVVKAEVSESGEERLTGIEAAGSRILPMDAKLLSKFETGNSVSQTETRRKARSARRRSERKKLRRARLLRTLRIMGWLPAHMASAIDDYGNIKRGSEPKMEWDGGNFLFTRAFEEMCAEFSARHPELKSVSHDWTVYYLRKKALREALTGQELAWVLLHFNQKRGYMPSRSDANVPAAKEGEKKEIVDVRVVGCKAAEAAKGRKATKAVTLIFDDGGEMNMPYYGTTPEEMVGRQMELLKTTKEGKTPTYTNPGENDWTFKKEKSKERITSAHKTVGEYLYDSLLEEPDVKLTGGKVTVLDRELYKSELEAILTKQAEFHDELKSPTLLAKCAEALYPNNPGHRAELMRHTMANLIMNDIILYQRPLKSKKSTIADCPFEYRTYMDKMGVEQVQKLKCAPRSHPLFQEFRLWQFVTNLRVTDEQTGKTYEKFDRVKLFDELTKKSKVKAADVLKIIDPKAFKKVKDEAPECHYRVNMVEGKDYPCYDTRAEIAACLTNKKSGPGLKAGDAYELITQTREEGDMTNEEYLWHISYSVTDPKEFEKAIKKWAETNGLPAEETARAFCALKPNKDYASYSLKAIKRLLPLMRMGRHWSFEAIDAKTRAKIEHFINGEEAEDMTPEIMHKWAADREDGGYDLKQAEESFQGLQPWKACMVVYGKLSGDEGLKWQTSDDIREWLDKFPHGSLRNPIVEQVVLETMRVVADVWDKHGRPDEIHIEMARELKKTNAERAEMTRQNAQREEDNERIRKILRELASTCEGVRPFSPIQQTKLKICVEGARLVAPADEPKIEEIEAYKHWIEQNYKSPYTGKTIALSRLFTEDYEIEHIIPRSRYYDDSFNNKVICEAKVNQNKDNKMAMEYINAAQGKEVDLGGGRKVNILTPDEYVKLINDIYKNNSRKRENLLRTELPQDFNNRQMNDSRYIAVKVKELLNNAVRAEAGDNGAGSKNVVVCTGAVTDRLKQDWGVNDKWNEIILPRFMAMDEKVADKSDSNNCFIAKSNGHLIPTVPTDMLKGFNKKRIDHRHHAMDAIVIACASRAMVQFFSNESSNKGGNMFENLKKSLCHNDANNGWVVNMPWETFPTDVKNALESMTVSIKHRQRIVTRTTNHYTVTKGGRREVRKQATYAIRQSLHKDTVWGLVNLQQKEQMNLKDAIKELRSFLSAKIDDPQLRPKSQIVCKPLRRRVSQLIAAGKTDKEILALLDAEADVWSEETKGGKVSVYTWSKDKSAQTYATRFLSSLSDLFGKLTDEEKIKDEIASITDTGIQKILLNHLAQWQGGAATAFSPDGIKWMNENIQTLNGGKPHKPIYKVRRTETSPLGKQHVGLSGNRRDKFVEADDGTNLFFAIYDDGKGGRRGFTVPLRYAIDRKLQGKPIVPDVDENGNKLLFTISPNDLVYIPKNGETEITDKSRIFKFVSCTKNLAMFIPNSVAKAIVDKTEFGSLNKLVVFEGVTIKNVCLPVEVDRLGNVTLKKIGEDD